MSGDTIFQDGVKKCNPSQTPRVSSFMPKEKPVGYGQPFRSKWGRFVSASTTGIRHAFLLKPTKLFPTIINLSDPITLPLNLQFILFSFSFFRHSSTQNLVPLEKCLLKTCTNYNQINFILIDLQHMIT